VIPRIIDAESDQRFIGSASQFHQVVAVKILKSDPSEAAIARFFDEREALARLEHPNITRIIDEGLDPENRPYLIMEFVDGKPIDEYVEQNHLPTTKRIQIFMEVCEAVQYAHQALIVHCDLKPSNILVGDSGRPRVLDFGVCRLLQRVNTEGNGLPIVQPLTPRFASPEQLRGEHVTTASDIFSLGLVLRTLLDSASTRDHSGLVTRVGNARFSNRAKGNEPSVSGAKGQLTAVREPGDLNHIIEKATRLEPTHRYESVRALFEDLQNYLHSRPVQARNSTWSYRTKLWLRRNALLASSGCVLFLVIVLAMTGIVRAWRGEAFERQTARAATDFLENLLGNSALQPDQSYLGLLHDASLQATKELTGRPAVEFSVRMSLARIDAAMWQWEQAKTESQRASELAAVLYGVNSEHVADALTIMGRAQTWLRQPKAVKTQRICLTTRTRLYGAIHPKTAESHINLGFALWWTTPRDRWREALNEYQTGIQIFRATHANSSCDYARALYNYVNFAPRIWRNSPRDSSPRRRRSRRSV